MHRGGPPSVSPPFTHAAPSLGPEGWSFEARRSRRPGESHRPRFPSRALGATRRPSDLTIALGEEDGRHGEPKVERGTTSAYSAALLVAKAKGSLRVQRPNTESHLSVPARSTSVVSSRAA
ncbi:hypothetical protein KM043_008184 [Ampulex compressa]|nr:hypothetical protein KM043_008184 [Ampulex compressa]